MNASYRSRVMDYLVAASAGLFFSISTFGQVPITNVTAHYTNGQIWVVWNVEQSVLTNCIPTLTPVVSNSLPITVSNCLAQTYAIYCSPNPVTNTTTATLVGRLFAQERSAAILRDDVKASFGVEPTGFRI